MYADDLVIFAPSIRGLNKLIKICEDYGKANDIIYNSKKSVTMTIRCKMCKELKFPLFTLNGIEMKEVTEFKYLGHILTNDLSDDKDIMRQRKHLFLQSNLLKKAVLYVFT